METKRKRKKRADSKCQHNEEALTRKWGRLYCIECQRENTKKVREKRKKKKIERDLNLNQRFFFDHC